MCKLAVLLVAVAALAVAPRYSAAATTAQGKADLQKERAALIAANIANEYIYDRNPNVLTLCTNKHKQPTDSEVFTQYIVGCVDKALGRTTINMKLKQSLTFFVDEALSTATTVERLARVTKIIACTMVEAAAAGK